MKVCAFAVLVCLTGPRVALADASNECVLKAVSHTLDAKHQFQTSLRDLIVRTRPEFKALAGISAQLQISLARRRAARLRYLLTHSPKRIVTDKGVSKFSNFAWSKDDEATFIARDDTYKALAVNVAGLRRQNNGHADWSDLRRFFRTELFKASDYKKIFKDYSSRRNELKKLVASCGV